MFISALIAGSLFLFCGAAWYFTNWLATAFVACGSVWYIFKDPHKQFSRREKQLFALLTLAIRKVRNKNLIIELSNYRSELHVYIFGIENIYDRMQILVDKNSKKNKGLKVLITDCLSSLSKYLARIKQMSESLFDHETNLSIAIREHEVEIINNLGPKFLTQLRENIANVTINEVLCALGQAAFTLEAILYEQMLSDFSEQVANFLATIQADRKLAIKQLEEKLSKLDERNKTQTLSDIKFKENVNEIIELFASHISKIKRRENQSGIPFHQNKS